MRIVPEVCTALHLEALLEAGFGLAGDLRNDRKNVPKRLPCTILPANEAKHEFYSPSVPRPVRGAFSALLGALAYAIGRLGYDARNPPESEG